MASVTVKNLSKQFPLPKGSEQESFLAVDDINLVIDDGEFLVLLGPSGCGKTTTLRCIAGLEEQTTGEIFIGDRLVNDLPAGDRDIAFVFQFYALYPHLSAFDNIAFPLRAMKVDKETVSHRVLETAELLRITHVLRRRPSSLPSGEQQRIALGRAIIRRPQAFLMDEPLTNLDASLRTDMRAELKRLQADLNTTMIYVTHDQTEAMSMAHRIAIMDQGVLQQVGSALDVYDKPQTLFVAGFIGTPPMNTIQCSPDNGYLVDKSDSFRLSLDVKPDFRNRIESRQSDELVFGVRAEDITLASSAVENSVSGQISDREQLGDEIIYNVRVGDNDIWVNTAPTLLLETGETVNLSFNFERIHMFDAVTEQAIF
jgi:ABC-type sugar transport system ATPase subunit